MAGVGVAGDAATLATNYPLDIKFSPPPDTQPNAKPETSNLLVKMASSLENEKGKTALLVVDMQEDFCPPVRGYFDQISCQND